MSDPNQSTPAIRLKVGLFVIAGLVLLGATTVYVNDEPFWWRKCQRVKINIEDGTGLKSKTPIKSLGIDIGYIRNVELSENHVTLGICVTAPVEILPTTRAYVRGDGLLGDKFVELKPVRYTGEREDDASSGVGDPAKDSAEKNAPEKNGADKNGKKQQKTSSYFRRVLNSVELFEAEALAADETPSPAATPDSSQEEVPVEDESSTNTVHTGRGGTEIPVGEKQQDMQHVVNRVDQLVNEMTSLTNNLRQAINPDELKVTMKQLNQTLENASKTLAPEGGLNQTAQRSLAKLEDAIEQLRDQMTRINQGKGSVGMLLNDPSYAEEIKEAIRNVNRLLSRVGGVRFIVNIGGQYLTGYNSGRAFGQLEIWPKPYRYYLLGVTSDPRGNITQISTQTTTTVSTGGVTTTTSQSSNSISTNQSTVVVTGMLGNVFFQRLDVSVGVLYGDGTLSTAYRLGPTGHEDVFQVRNDIYSHVGVLDDRISAQYTAWGALYVNAGLESFHTVSGSIPVYVGAGVRFDDEDIKLLFMLK